MADNIIDNSTTSLDIQQKYPDTCAIKSQQIILHDFGIDVSEDLCVQIAAQNGWYNHNGTSPENVGKILLEAGIPCSSRHDANVFDLVHELSLGHKIIVGVDSGELWNDDPWLEDVFKGEQADHALIVAGLDFSDPSKPEVILTDPGTGDRAKHYPLDQFMDAWHDSQCFMVSTSVATPEAKDFFVNNNLIDGHINMINGVDYNTITMFQDYTHMPDFNYLDHCDTLWDMFNNYPNFNDVLVNYQLPTDYVPTTEIAFSPYDPNVTYTPDFTMPELCIDPFIFNYDGLGF